MPEGIRYTQNHTEELKNGPVLLALNFAKELKLAIDAIDTGADSFFLQEDSNGVDHPVYYFSKKFSKHHVYHGKAKLNVF